MFWFFIGLINAATANKQVCNGVPGACDLTISELTMAGAHNAGAGFDGLLKYHTKLMSVTALSCPYRNQKANIYEMLNAGIRFFDIDLCFEHDNSYGAGLWTCHSGAFGGPMTKFFDQIDRWMNEPKNRNEIIALQFNRDYEKGEEKNIGTALMKELKSRWNPSNENIRKKKLSMQTYLHETIGQAVKTNQRIYTFVHYRLREKLYEPFLLWEHYIGYTWQQMGYVGSNECKKLSDAVSNKCGQQGEHQKLVRLDLTLTWGLCNDDMAYKCNQLIADASNKCYANIKKQAGNKRFKISTVNFIVVDYAHRYPGVNTVKIAKEMTLKYIAAQQ